MKYLKEFLKFLSGKKTTIATILGAIIAYLTVYGVIGKPEVILITTILIALGLGSNVATKKLVYKEDK